jgi:hypothetical protein
MMKLRNRKLEEIVRHFPENGMKLLLENPLNVRDLLALAAADILELIDLRQLALVRTTFVKRDYRHVESDVVLGRRAKIASHFRIPSSRHLRPLLNRVSST